jgi:murein DD-endopeptidase MepM/ murein hydrolase activator NlpD
LTACAAIAGVAATTVPSAAPSNRAIASVRRSQFVTTSPTAAARAKSSVVAADQSPERFTGRVGTDLSKSLLAAGVPDLQGREYVALLARAIPLSNGLSVDDRFDLILERNEDGSPGQLAYAGLDRIARADVELMKWTDGRHVIWINADSDGAEASDTMRMPVAGRITSGFGERFHPVLGYERFHAGVDLGAPAGTPIVAAANGRVISAGWRGGYGQEVSISHSGGLETRYGHMSRIAAFAGELVRRGEVIGYVGSTGMSTGPHLHFEVRRNGTPVNPLSVKLGGDAGQPQGAELVAFHDELRKLLVGASPRS